MRWSLNTTHRGHLAQTLAFSSIIVLMLLLTSNAMQRVDELNRQLNMVVREYNQKLSLLQTMRRMARERIFTMHHMLLISDPFELDENAQEIDEYGAAFTAARTQFFALPASRGEKQLHNMLTQQISEAVPQQREAINNILSGKRELAYQQLINEVLPRQHQVLATLAHLEAMQANAIEQTVAKAEEGRIKAHADFMMMGGASLLLILLIYLLSLWLTRNLSHQAHHDPLTGITNRRGFEQVLHRLLGQKSSSEVSFLCMMDLDNFKPVNDTCGHAAGDLLLRQLVQSIGDQIRREDILARLGGDEFALLLRECPLEQTLRITHAIRKVINNHPYKGDSHEFELGISIGVVPIDPGEQNERMLMERADQACYSAKESGRNRTHISLPTWNGTKIVEFNEALLQQLQQNDIQP